MDDVLPSPRIQSSFFVSFFFLLSDLLGSGFLKNAGPKTRSSSVDEDDTDLSLVRLRPLRCWFCEGALRKPVSPDMSFDLEMSM